MLPPLSELRVGEIATPRSGVFVRITRHGNQREVAIRMEVSVAHCQRTFPPYLGFSLLLPSLGMGYTTRDIPPRRA